MSVVLVVDVMLGEEVADADAEEVGVGVGVPVPVAVLVELGGGI